MAKKKPAKSVKMKKPASREAKTPLAGMSREMLATFATLLETIPDAAYIKDLDGRNVMVNQAYAALVRLPAKQVLGRTDDGLLPADLAAACRKGDAKVLKSRRSHILEDRTKDGGSERVFSTIKSPVFDAAGKAVGVLGISRDVTEEQRTREALGTVREQLRLLIDESPLILWAVDLKGRITLSEGQALKGLGLKPGETVGLDVFKLYKHNARGLKNIKAALAGKHVFDIVPEAGRLLATHLMPRRDRNGTITGMLGICRDVTDEEHTREALQSAEERLRMVVSDAPVVLFAMDKDGRFTMSEGRGLASLGLAPGEVVGKSAFDLYKDNPGAVADLKRALGGEAFTSLIEMRGIHFETHYTPERDDAGAVTGLAGVAIEVTARVVAEKEREELLAREKLLREEAEAANRSKDEFLALLSHELRTPMTAMMGWAWLLRSRELSGAEHQMALDSIERNMRSQAQIIEDLLDISRVVTGKMRIESRPIEIAPVLCSAVDVVRPAAEARKISIDLEPLLPASRVKGDPERLQQVFWNLLMNAVKFTPTGGKVVVRFREAGKTVGISVADSGIGLTPDALERIFDPFTQAEKSLTRQHGGLGLGLAIVRHIVHAHGGSVEARSDGPGKGADFRVLLPLFTDKVTESDQRPAPPPERLTLGKMPDLSGLHVLVVEDDVDTLSVLQAVLSHCGARVTTAGSASEAFSALERLSPDVLISDLAMPGEDGYSLIRRIRDLPEEKGGRIPAAALTARTHTEDRTRVLLAGFQMYLPKPIDPAELAAVVLTLKARKR